MKNILSQRDDLIADIGKKLKEAVTKVTNAFAYESELAQISVCVCVCGGGALYAVQLIKPISFIFLHTATFN